jgi:hypothetical protein
VAKLSGFANPEIYVANFPSDAPFVYLHAAELALAIDDVRLAIEVLTELLTSIETLPRTHMQLCWFVLAGAITGNLIVELGPYSFSVWQTSGYPVDDPLINLPWPNESVVAVEVARRLLPASVAISQVEDGLPEIEKLTEESFGKASWRALQLTSEYQAVSQLWSHSAKIISDAPGLSELEERYAERTRRAIARSELHNSAPMGIVDFALLGIYVGMERQNKSKFLNRRDDLPEVIFLREMAAKIALITSPFDGEGQVRLDR